MAINSPLEFFGYDKLGHHSSALEDSFDAYTSTFPSLFVDSNESSSTNVNYAFAPNLWAYSSSSVLSFNQQEYYSSPDQDECDLWIDSTDQNNLNGDQYIINNHIRKGAIRDCNVSSEDVQFMYNADQKSIKSDKIAQKRRLEVGDEKIDKKQCGVNKKTKIKANSTSSPSKDPQSLAAKNRRERISERLKVLQELIPNGTKVDMVTMLEKAFSYVKFLQLQVKVLATDEFWPAQGKKAPDISQVSEALDAILSSQRA
ncbi:hypothetical protein LUZ60_012794 [Juncus effusus]|nr:hypothetical protein LUZ60_012794 [Juncus effusus]